MLSGSFYQAERSALRRLCSAIEVRCGHSPRLPGKLYPGDAGCASSILRTAALLVLAFFVSRQALWVDTLAALH